jgi:hypothetical protein
MNESEVVERLDSILAVLQLAHHDAIERAAERIRRDPVNGAILEACSDDWVAAGKLSKQVSAEVGISERRVRDRFVALTARRVLLRRGSGSVVEYRSTGLV